MQIKKLFERELQALKPWDIVQSSHLKENYQFITTAGHGYLVVPKDDARYEQALKIVEYGFKGDHAVYLEEDSEVHEFVTSYLK